MPNINTGHLEQLIDAKFPTRNAFADHIGVSRQYVSEVLRGKINPSLERLIQFADALDACIDDLVVRGNKDGSEE